MPPSFCVCHTFLKCFLIIYFCCCCCCFFQVDTHLVLLLNDLGGKALEGFDGDAGDKSVHLLSCILILVGLAGEVDADAVGDAADTLGPHVFVDRDIKTDISGAHSLLCELLDGTDGLGCTLLEGTV